METNQLFSSNSSREMRGFVFNRLQQTDNQNTLYSLRLISKSERERVEKKIQTTKINFCDIENFFATSKFSERIKFLEVCFRIWQDSFENLKYLSSTYLPYALNINAKVYPSYCHEEKPWYCISLEMPGPLTFRCLHIVNYGKLCRIWITGKYNVQIQDCEFIGVSVHCHGNANVNVSGSKFLKASTGLQIGECDSAYMDEISLDNCSFAGLTVETVKEAINITNVRVFSCPHWGIYIGKNMAKFKLSNTTIKDCETGIRIMGSCCGEIQKTNFERCRRCGILLSHGAIMHYAAVEFKLNKQDVYIYDDISQFLPLENIQ